MLKLEFSTQFKKDYKRAKKRGCKETDLRAVVYCLMAGEKLPEKYKDHPLSNYNNKVYRNLRECHINPDWLLIYYIDDEKLVLKLIRTGSHSDLFG